MTVNTERYLEFVNGVTSQQSKDHEAFVYSGYKNSKVKDFLPATDISICRYADAEAGEFTEVVKKIVFQGKTRD